ncbi:MAG: FAD-dependent oxidoreductase [Bifidobacteriaceae bacterium]|jgi:electron transfer flavoprotein-quinone oxidoreductase|nr:FAD-dependent oxidoreductase [Bifidobacteriaceae bacterium]
MTASNASNCGNGNGNGNRNGGGGHAVDFDVIVVGAGVAGCATAFQLADAGHSVLLVERGPEPGAKSLSGGVFYCRVMEQIFPGFTDAAPIERVITRNCVSFLNPSSFVNIDYADDRLAQPVNAVSVLRSKLDAWLSDQCERAGAMVMAGFRVDRLLVEHGQVCGIGAGEDELRCHVVVAADGVNSFIARDAGLRTKDPANHLAVGLKSVIGLERGVIEDRFNLERGQGAAYAVVGDCTAGVGGGGFMYTNLESVSIGVVLRLDDLARRGLKSADLLDRFVGHRFIAPFLKGGEPLEYGAHLVAEGGQAMMRDLVAPGFVVVGEAAGLALNTGLTVRGMDLAAGSAIAAAETVKEALAAGDCSPAILSGYPRRLAASFVGKDMTTYRRAPALLEGARIFNDYGPLLANVLHGVYDLDLSPRRRLWRTARDTLKTAPLGLRHLAGDGWKALRAL